VSTFFVTGIDTEIGKTFATAAMLEAAAQHGMRTLGLKPVAAGAENIDGQWQNDDAIELMRASSVKLPYSTVNPVCLPEPVSPHISARLSGRRVDVHSLIEACKPGMETETDLTLIEGAGGWRVPLNDNETLADFAKALQLPVILVVGLRLGCLNHACLSAEAIAHDGLNLAGWIANSIDPEMRAHDDNIQSLISRIDAPLLGHIPFIYDTAKKTASEFVDINKLFAQSES
jgi:dethiobiotin synthetase